LIALSVLPSASEARAQMTVDVAKITRRQYLFDRNLSPRAPMIAKPAQRLFQWAEKQYCGGSRRYGQEQG
jgi:hypothetical protein